MSAEILQPYAYLASNPGKNFRDALIAAVAECLGVASPCAVRAVRDCINKLHIASMLIDDVEDGATMRRGRPAAHTVFGPALTINCSHYVVFEAMSHLDPALHPVFLAEVMALHRGQGLDIYWRDQLKCPTEHEYLAMVTDKTGGLLRMAFSMLWELSPKGVPRAALTGLADALGVWYQIRDDLLNLTSGEYHAAKGFCEDIGEGKYSFPVVHCIQTAPAPVARELEEILELRTSDVSIKKRALELLDAARSLEYTAAQQRAQFERLLAAVAELPNSGALHRLLAER